MIELSDAERDELEAIVRRRTAQQRMVVRARIVLAASVGEENAVIAEGLEVALNTSVDELLTDGAVSGIASPASAHRGRVKSVSATSVMGHARDFAIAG